MEVNGTFILTDPGTKKVIRVPNFITNAGAQFFLQRITQAAAMGEDGNFWMGLCGLNADATTTLATMPAEPSSAGGYARQELNDNDTDWPTANLAAVNGVYRIRSVPVTFAASGADYSTSIHRFFLCDDEAGTDGTVFAISQPLPTGLLITDGTDRDVAYELALA